MALDPNDPRVQAGAAVAGAILPATGPWGLVASTVLSTGLAYWSEYSRKMAAGQLTEADVRDAQVKTGGSIDALEAEVLRREQAGVK